MKKRLRKKKRVGEFRELGFELFVVLDDKKPPEELDALIDAWIEAVEARGLDVGGGYNTNKKEFRLHMSRYRTSATHDDRAFALAYWSREDVALVTVDKLACLQGSVVDKKDAGEQLRWANPKYEGESLAIAS